MIMKPGTSTEQGDFFFGTGKGVQHVFNDSISGMVVNNNIISNFQQERYTKGFEAAIAAIGKELKKAANEEIVQ